jgi:hypothetical protein
VRNKDAPDTVREYMSGFANSAGGILIIGINAPDGIPVEVTACVGHKKGDLADWAARCLTPIASFFSPQPRFHVVDHPKGDILVGVVQRSLMLVPRREAESIVYHFRLHDQTLKAPDYLMADILLGRRQQPILQIYNHRIWNFRRSLDNSIGSMYLDFDLRLEFENSSIIWADECRWGMISWSKDTTLSINRSEDPGRHLLSFIEVLDTPNWSGRMSPKLTHTRGVFNAEEPFETSLRDTAISIPLRVHNDWFSYIWQVALYITAKNSMPIWYQLNINVNIDIVKLVEEKANLNGNNKYSELIRLTTERPVVAWRDVPSPS